MATSTDVPIYTTTLGSAAASVTIDLSAYQQYKNLKIVATGNHDGAGSSVNNWRMQFNGDTASNYSDTVLYGTGSSAGSVRDSNQNFIYCGLIGQTSMTYAPLSTFYIMNYANTIMNKTVLVRGNAASDQVNLTGGTWRSNSAITSITLFMSGQNLKAGTTISVYGIGSATTGAKATGGAIYSDKDYIYHVFGSSATFTPLQSLTADILVVGGGGGGCLNVGAGGGAGKVVPYSAQSLSATGYTVTVGAGGSASISSAPGNGGSSQFGALAASTGGNAAQYAMAGTGGTSGNGYTGGSGFYPGPPNIASGGGGGAGGNGYTAVQGGQRGNGGIGLTSSLMNAIGAATGAGQTVAGVTYFGGGGGGGTTGFGSNGGWGAGPNEFGAGGLGGGGDAGGGSRPGSGYAGLALSGGGGGGGTWDNSSSSYYGGQGGSGIVVVRYAK